MNTRRFTFASMLLLAVASSALAQDTFDLKRKPKAGATLNFTLTVNADFSGQQILVTAKTAEKILEVKPNGDFVVETKQTDTKVKVSGQEFPAGEESTDKVTYNAAGLVQTIAGDNTDSSTYRMQNLALFVAPKDAVKVGDKWTQEFKADSKTGAVAAGAEYEVVAAEKVGSWDTVKIKWTFAEKEGGEPASCTGFLWISKEDGSLVKLTGDAKNAPIPGAPGPINMNIVIERQ